MPTLRRVAYAVGVVAAIGYVGMVSRYTVPIQNGGVSPPGSVSDGLGVGGVPFDAALNRTPSRRRPPAATDAEFAEHMRRVQVERQRQLASGCRRLLAREGARVRAVRPEFDRTFNVPSLRLTYCATPKCGTTTWFNFFARTENSACRKSGPAIHSCVRAKFYRPRSAAGFLPNSLVIVRDPWRRLVSAYEDKFVQERHGMAASCYRRHGKELRGRPDVTFAEFVRCLLEDHRRRRTLDAHIAPLHWQCSVCKIKYSYIAKLETLTDDFRYLASHVFPNRSLQAYSHWFSSVRRRSVELRNTSSAVYEDCYRSLKPNALAALVKVYRPDAQLLGYPLAPLSGR